MLLNFPFVNNYRILDPGASRLFPGPKKIEALPPIPPPISSYLDLTLFLLLFGGTLNPAQMFDKNINCGCKGLNKQFYPVAKSNHEKRGIPIIFSMVLISDGNLEMGAHVRSNLCYLIRLGRLVIARAVTSLVFFFPKCKVTNLIFFRKDFFFMRAQHVLNHFLYKR